MTSHHPQYLRIPAIRWTQIGLMVTVVVSAACARDDSAVATNDTAATVAGSPATTVPGVSETVDSPSRAGCTVAAGAKEITANGIGPAQLNTSIENLRNICAVRDTALRADEGQPATAYVLSVGGTASVLIFADGPKAIRQVTTSDALFRSSGGIGVGSTIAQLKQAHGRLCGGLGATGIEVWPAAMKNVVYGTTAHPPKMPGGGTGLARDASAVPDTAHVTVATVSQTPRKCA